LLANALMYGDPEEPVKLVATRDDTRVRVTVTGQGRGPDAEEAQHLFERFYRGKSAADAGQAGSGLGLFTARGIVRGHAGDVRYVNGDTFEVDLPLTS
jgi:signal transduction histidine kinase